MQTKIKWQTNVLSDLTSQELLQIAIARQNVFVIEQKRLYPEMDTIDEVPTTIHLMGTINGSIVAYARIFRNEEGICFGRVLSDKNFRGQGLGKQLMNQVIKVIKNHYDPSEIVIEAQVDKEHFYNHYGLKKKGDEFLFNSTPHYKMIAKFDEIHSFF